MGFAALPIAEIATDYSVTVEKVFSLWNRQRIAYRYRMSRRALADATTQRLSIALFSCVERQNF
ncbi:hypothetical protein IQ259_23985 [Fortiea sp. LEGE XX443]|uniref:hypothetical protein n=1 Tax=Fortiea sp. LEGE XX443 TaxID=1828611 RepID=UPI001880AF73|nr:hypothetical protein [Fortiea sp. LEGE XX443]MBE9008036.1 hypothetical protein [Fortiea sp. LEGE XX443]